MARPPVLTHRVGVLVFSWPAGCHVTVCHVDRPGLPIATITTGPSDAWRSPVLTAVATRWLRSCGW